MQVKSKQGKFALGFALLLLVFGRDVAAEIYKWVDPSGKVHYSDRKLNQAAESQSVDIGSMPPAQATDQLSPRKYAGAEPSKWLIRTALDWSAYQHALATDKLAYMYFGGDCVSPATLDYAEFNRRYSGLLGDISSLNSILSRNLDVNGYRNMSNHSNLPKRDQNKHLALLLNQQVEKIRINACKTNIGQTNQTANLNRFTFGEFSRNNVWLSIRWTLEDPDTGVTLFVQSTQGSGSTLEGRSENPVRSLEKAYSEALNNLLAQPEFAAAVTPSVTPRVAPAAEARVSDNPPRDEPQGLSGVMNSLTFGALRKSKVAQALGLVTPLKTQVAQYYLETGEWPSSFVDMQLSSRELREPGLIEQVEMRLGGVIQIALDPAEFGSGRIVQLQPRETMGGTSLSWDCKTNLENQYRVGNCTGF